MNPLVRQGWISFTSRFEGVVPFMYLDVKGLVTTAIGNLIDPVDAALSLPWKRPDGTDATPAEVIAEWHVVKGRTDLELAGGGHFAPVTKLRLTDEGILAVVSRRLDQMDASLARRYPDWEALPPAAQTAILSMSWAAGPGFVAPHFDAALRARDWAACAKECHLDDAHNPGLRPRNAANMALFLSLLTAAPDGPVANETLPCLPDGDVNA